MKYDLLVWIQFLDNFNGITYIHDIIWITNIDLQLFTDSVGGKTKGCGAYFAGKWRNYWDDGIFRDITSLELIPIGLAIFLWGREFKNKKKDIVPL